MANGVNDLTGGLSAAAQPMAQPVNQYFNDTPLERNIREDTLRGVRWAGGEGVLEKDVGRQEGGLGQFQPRPVVDLRYDPTFSGSEFSPTLGQSLSNLRSADLYGVTGSQSSETGGLFATPGASYRLMVGGKEVGAASTPQEMERLAALASEVGANKKADVRIQGKFGPTQDWTDTFVNAPDVSGAGIFADFVLPAIGGVLLPGVGGVLGGALGAGLGAAAGSGLSSALQGRSFGDALTRAALSGVTAGGLSAATGTPLMSAAGAKGAGLGSGLVPSDIAGTGSLGFTLNVTVAPTPNFTAGSLGLGGISGIGADALDDIVVTGARITPPGATLPINPFNPSSISQINVPRVEPPPAGAESDDPELLAEAERIKRFEAEAAAAAGAAAPSGALSAAESTLEPEAVAEAERIKRFEAEAAAAAAAGAAAPTGALSTAEGTVEPEALAEADRIKRFEAEAAAAAAAGAAADQTGDKKKDTLDKIADAATIAGLVIPAIGALAGGGGKGGTGTYTSGAGALNPIFSGKLPTPGEGGAFRVGGLDYTTPPARSAVDMYRYAMGPAMDIPAGMDLSGATSPYAGFGPGTLGRETFNRVTGLEVPPRPTGFEVAPSPTGDLTNRKVGETKVVDGDTYVWGGNQNGWQRQYKDPTTGETKLFSGNGATSVTSLADMLASGMATQRPANQPFFKQNLTNIPDWANTYRNWQTAMRGAGVPEAERSAAEREFMTALEQRPFGNAKELFDFARGLLDRSRRPKAAARGGPMGYSRGSSRESFAVEGPGTGRSDDIPAVLSDGEYVIDAETVALLGDGSSRAGAKKLDELRVKVRKHKGKNLAAGKFSVNAKNPEAYMRGGRI